ncbi:TetR/AcrR family transcriptional regulator [Mycolicibacterium palauense]|uniref:TetR/AcrR family transcriptional regulator n=1 Tax=Mycolicibacterium palauense TaxID=2034511 RepID=UPI000BFEE2B1|nr:TetR family transcriptional regulator [Mycolicibacterium palauense]
MRRKPNPEQRRRELCDTAVRLLAEDGLKGVSHLKVDRKAGFPDGTTSFYFRTRSALVHAVAARIAELDRKDLTAATRSRADNGDAECRSPSGLAQLVVRSATGARLTRTKARAELALQAARDAELDEALRGYTEGFLVLIREAIEADQAHDHNLDPALVDEQAYVVMMFISGLMLSSAGGVRKAYTAEEVDRIISGIIGGVGAVFGDGDVREVGSVSESRRRGGGEPSSSLAARRRARSGGRA